MTNDLKPLLDAAGLDMAGLTHILQKLADGRRLRFAKVEIEIINGKTRRVTGPAPIEEIKTLGRD